MKAKTEPVAGGPEWLTLTGSGIFIFILWFSAIMQADIRWLHFFQSRMYLATIAACLRHNRWGNFIGISAAGLRDYGNLFTTTFLSNGLRELAQWAPWATPRASIN